VVEKEVKMDYKRMDEKIRHRVFERDNYTCRYCGSKEGPLHADHVYPWSKGGETSIENLVTACRSCNGKKSNKVGMWPIEKVYVRKEPVFSYIGFAATIVTFGIYCLFQTEFSLSLSVTCFLVSIALLFWKLELKS
jgi:hypothetical protein